MPHYFGIDLGTTNSAIAYLDENGQPAVVPNTVTGHLTTPSVVYFQEPTEVAVGDVARNAAIAEPEHVVSLVKRSMGEARTFTMHGIDHTPESISALILRHLFEDAQQTLGSEDNSVVITVPAYFGMRETQATVEAGTLAGLNVVSTIPEPIAPAQHYGCAPGSAVETLLVFDLGGGTFDTSVLRVGAKSIDTVVVDGDRQLGGADWDLRLVQWLTEQFAQRSGCDPAELADDGFQQLMLQQAEAAKIQLSQVPSTKVPIRFGAKAVTLVLTREVYEELTADLLNRAIDVVRRTLATAGTKSIRAKDISDVLLVGGATLMPSVQRRLVAYTKIDNVETQSFHFFEQNGDSPSPVIALNREVTPPDGFVFRGLPKLRKGSPITILVTVDEDGLATVEAYENKSGQRLETNVQLGVLQEQQLQELEQALDQVDLVH